MDSFNQLLIRASVSASAPPLDAEISEEQPVLSQQQSPIQEIPLDEPSAEERTNQPETSPSAPQSPKIITDEEDPECDIQQQEITVQAANPSMSDLFSFSIEHSQLRRILAQDIQCRTIQISGISYQLFCNCCVTTHLCC
uniref:Uncharacterized protein n=1 Tax=Setaria viridis TaxID=4556 RepID=A0A4U6T9C1_SETVI|nr:hypothetical protein SEVIR_9G565100v2 [Setaria viridis]TKV98520.1 hypothetical protein SEVIR_9G565100v2 [Setaria viridis]